MAAATDSQRAAGQRRTTVVSIAVASALVAIKLGVGLATHSLGLVSVGIESSGDMVAAVLTFFAVRLGGRPADRGHPYGHRRAENLGALGESAILLGGAVLVCVEAVRRLGSGGVPRIHWYQFAVLGVALALDLSRTSVSLAAARRYASPALRSNAFHFAADMGGSLAVLAGLLAVDAGLRDGDAIAALVVAAIILAVAVRLIGENANVLMDRSPVHARAMAEQAIVELGGDVELSRLRLRESGGRYFADVVVSVPPGQAVVEGHDAADHVEAAVQRALPGSDVVVHVEPRRRGLDLRDRVLAIALAEPLVKEAHDIAIFQRDGAASVSLHLKFPAGLDLLAAHDVAQRIEREIARRPEVADVQTHLEPLEQPLSARATDAREEQSVREEALRVVREHAACEPAAYEPAAVKVLSTQAGRVLFVTLAVGAGRSLSDAHELAGRLEDELRGRIAGIADVVVRTEP